MASGKETVFTHQNFFCIVILEEEGTMSDRRVFTASRDFEKGLDEAMKFFKVNNKELIEHRATEGKKTLFGLKKGEMEFEFFLANDPLLLTDEFLNTLFEKSGIKTETSLELKNNTVIVAIKKSSDDKLFADNDGELIKSIEHCLKIYLNKVMRCDSPIRARVESETFSSEHEAQLHDLALKKKKQALNNQADAIIKPLSPSDRYIIHQFLDKDPQVTTVSIGEGHFKRIKVSPIILEGDDANEDF